MEFLSRDQMVHVSKNVCRVAGGEDTFTSH